MNEAFADRSIVLHIGPHKTGTTAIQNALWHSAERLRELGVAYPGGIAHEMSPAMSAALGRVDPGKDFAWHRAHWDQMVADLRADGVRIGVLSSEFYSEAEDERIAWLLDHLGSSTQVVITLRPLARIIPSQWQQYVQNGLRLSYTDWLHNALDDPEAPQVRRSFWARHRHDRLVRRWADAAGVDRVTVVVVDDRHPASLPAAFERLLGVPAGTLVGEDDGRNRSLTFDEVETVRTFNHLGKDEIARPDYDRFIRFGAIRDLQAHPSHPGDQRLLTPRWAIERAAAISAGFADEIRATGVRVIGSLDVLHDPELAPAEGENLPSAGIDAGTAAAFAAGLLNKMSNVPGGPDIRPDAAPVETAVWRRHRAVNLRREPDLETRLLAERDALRDAADAYVPAASATRAQVLRELARRVRTRLSRTRVNRREAGSPADGK